MFYVGMGLSLSDYTAQLRRHYPPAHATNTWTAQATTGSESFESLSPALVESKQHKAKPSGKGPNKQSDDEWLVLFKLFQIHPLAMDIWYIIILALPLNKQPFILCRHVLMWWCKGFARSPGSGRGPVGWRISRSWTCCSGSSAPHSVNNASSLSCPPTRVPTV